MLTPRPLENRRVKFVGSHSIIPTPKLLNFESLLDLIKKSRDDNDDESRQALTNDTINASKISRHKTKVIIYNRPELKQYKIVY